jgi:hypothetical protein
MTDEQQRQEIMRRQAEGMRAMGYEEMTRLQLEAAARARNVYPELTSWQLAQASRNFWRQEGSFTPAPMQPPPLTWWARIRAVWQRTVDAIRGEHDKG